MSKKVISYIENKVGYDRIGIGTYSVIFKAGNKALKVFYEKYTEDHEPENEITIHKSLNHPNIPTFYNSGKIDRFTFIEMEYINGLNLFELLDWSGIIQTNIPEIIIKAIISQASDVLYYLHTQKIINRDIKPSNLLISRNGTLYLVDFGTARRTQHDLVDIDGANFRYYAPEQINQSITSFKSEVWNLGIIIHELITGKTPIDEDYLREQINIAPIIIPNCSYELQELLKSSLRKNQSDRISSFELKEQSQKLMTINNSREILKGFVNNYLNSKALQEYLKRLRNSYMGDLIDLKPFIRQARQEEMVQIVAV